MPPPPSSFGLARPRCAQAFNQVGRAQVCSDLLCHCCCHSCSLAREAREIRTQAVNELLRGTDFNI